MKIFDNIWLLLFLLWLLPLIYYRSKFRKIVYRTFNWEINIQPRFGKEIKALFGNIYPYDAIYIRTRNLYRLYLLVFVLLFFEAQVSGINSSTENSTDMKKIEIGNKIPSFQLKDQHGNWFNVESVLGKKNLVLFFYPKDDTPGCTKEACYFRDLYEDFVEADAEVIGISGQSTESHKQFAEKYHLSYTLLSDKGNQLRKKFGVPANIFGLLPGRVTYVVNKDGEVIHIFNSQSNITGHVEEALKILQN
jgi:peroxiredoxin Q/BCP